MQISLTPLNCKKKNMTRKILIMLLATMLLLDACNSNKNSENTQEVALSDISTDTAVNIPFQEATNYFVKNTYEDSAFHSMMISSQEVFDSIFGMAAFMGKDGKPSPIDFSTQNVLALIGQTTDLATTIKVQSLESIDSTIVLTYIQTIGEKQSATIRPVVLLTIDKQIQGSLQVIKEE